jgi:hypothetical protein
VNRARKRELRRQLERVPEIIAGVMRDVAELDRLRRRPQSAPVRSGQVIEGRIVDGEVVVDDGGDAK